MTYGVYAYNESREVQKHNYGFYALIMAAMRKADDINIAKLKSVYPDLWDEFYARYHAPGGLLEGEQ